VFSPTALQSTARLLFSTLEKGRNQPASIDGSMRNGEFSPPRSSKWSMSASAIPTSNVSRITQLRTRSWPRPRGRLTQLSNTHTLIQNWVCSSRATALSGA